MPRAELDVAVVGSGFAGSILARTLVRQGLRVALLERDHHPRFALGESSTPLANFCLERLARRYRLPDLHRLAAWGRWMAAYPEVRRGLKRGFTFYSHRPETPFSPGEHNRNRLLVAASPEDELADSHWLRADVDAFLARRAVEEGVELREGFEVEELSAAKGGFDVVASGGETVTARFVVDATGPRGVVGTAVGAGRCEPPARFCSRLVYGHFSGVGVFDAGKSFEPGPYPDERAAVHHLLAEGWMYVLRFDHDCTSAGLVLDGDADVEGPPETVWWWVVDRYPSLARQFAGVATLRQLAAIEPIQYRRRRAAAAAEGKAWALLPHAFAFFDPMFSTGIAWSLLGVERLAGAFETLTADPDGGELARRFAAYDRLLRREAAQIERLIHGAGLARRDPRLFAAQSFLYFAAASYEELRQRLGDDPAAAADRGFLGAGEPGWESLFEEAVSRLAGLARCDGPVRDRLAAGFAHWVRRSIEPWNLIGLADPARHNLYPVDLAVLRDRCRRLDLSPEELDMRLPRLRGGRARSNGH